MVLKIRDYSSGLMQKIETGYIWMSECGWLVKPSPSGFRLAFRSVCATFVWALLSTSMVGRLSAASCD